MARVGGVQIGELSRRSRCNIETIRYYEQIGLLPRPPRNASRNRLYGPDDVSRLTFVRRARELGFSIEEVRVLLALSTERDCSEVREVAANHLIDVRARIADLRAMERVLADAVRRCEAGEVLGCPLIDTLSATQIPLS